MGFAEGINDFMGSIFGREGLLGKSGISEFLGDKVAKPVLKAGYGDIIGKGSSDWKGSDILRALAGFVGMGAGAEYLAPSGGSPWDKAGSGLSGLWDKFGSGTGQTPLTGEETSFLSGLGDMSGWEESGSGGGMSISKLSDMLKGMGGQQKQSGGGNQSLEPLYRLLEATKQGQNVPPAPIQPLPPMQSMF